MQQVTEATASKLFSGIRYVLLDLDGVIWAGDTVFANAPAAVTALRNSGRVVRMLSNNATVSREEMLQKKFLSNGFAGTRVEDLYTSAWTASEYLRSLGKETKGLFDRNVFIIGNQGLHDEIRKVLAPGCITYGMELTSPKYLSNTELVTNHTPFTFAHAVRCVNDRILPPPLQYEGTDRAGVPVSLQDLEIGAVVVALDFAFSPWKLNIATMCLQMPLKKASDGRCTFIATNTDPSFPIINKEGQIWMLAGGGTCVSALQVAIGREPDANCGKPHQNLFDLFLKEETQRVKGTAEKPPVPSECLMVGDRLTTDIQFGKQAGARTLFVLSGAETLEDIRTTGITPDFYADSLVGAVKAAGLMNFGKMSSSL